jgi:hypothetical protein
VIQGLPHDSLIFIYLVILHEVFQDLRESRDKLAARGCVAVAELQVFQLLAQTRGQHPDF